MIVIASVGEWVLGERTTVSVLHMCWGFCLRTCEFGRDLGCGRVAGLRRSVSSPPRGCKVVKLLFADNFTTLQLRFLFLGEEDFRVKRVVYATSRTRTLESYPGSSGS